jgi:hypothetical protein
MSWPDDGGHPATERWRWPDLAQISLEVARIWPGSRRDLAGDDQDPASLSTSALLHPDEVAGLELRPDLFLL